MIHELKIKKEYFEKVRDGQKRFEIRKDDRNYKVGDSIILREIDDSSFQTGNRIECKILYILKDFDGLKHGYVILSILETWRNIIYDN